MTVALAGDSVRGSARGFAAQRAPRGERRCVPHSRRHIVPHSPCRLSDYRRHIVPLVSLWIRATVVVVAPVGMLATRMVVNISTGGRLGVFRVARGRAWRFTGRGHSAPPTSRPTAASDRDPRRSPAATRPPACAAPPPDAAPPPASPSTLLTLDQHEAHERQSTRGRNDVPAAQPPEPRERCSCGQRGTMFLRPSRTHARRAPAGTPAAGGRLLDGVGDDEREVMVALGLVGGPVPERGVQPSPVVELLDVLEDRAAGLFVGSERPPAQPLLLK